MVFFKEKKIYVFIMLLISVILLEGCGKYKEEYSDENLGEMPLMPENAPILRENTADGSDMPIATGIEHGADQGMLETADQILNKKELMVADFNNGEPPNELGGNFGAWDKNPADFSQGCTESFDSVNRFGNKGFAIKLEYDVDSKNPAYNGFWMFFGNLNAGAYDNLVFTVKGDTKVGYTSVFKIEVKNIGGQVGRYYVTGNNDTWQTIVIPFDDLEGITDFSNLTEFVIVFEDRIVTKKTGVIYIDDIKLTKSR